MNALISFPLVGNFCFTVGLYMYDDTLHYTFAEVEDTQKKMLKLLLCRF